MPDIFGQTVGGNDGNNSDQSNSSFLGSLGRKSISQMGTLTKSFVKNKSIAKKFTKKASAIVDSTLVPKDGDKPE